MKRGGDPYDALASIFLPGSETTDAAAPSPALTDESEVAAGSLPAEAERLLRDALGEPAASAESEATSPTGALMSSGTTRPRGGRPLVETTVSAVSGGLVTPAESRPADRSDVTNREQPGDFPWPSRQAGGGSVEFELLVPGHLPIRAAAWLVPCVRAIAGRDHAAGLFRCEDGTVDLELHGPAPVPPAARSLAETIDAIRGPVRRWFLRPPQDLDVESMAEAEPDRVTILTGGDPVAVASAWEIARRVIAGADEARWTRPRLGLAVVGVPRAQAELIVDQLDRITRERLGTSVELRCCVPRIEPGGVPAGVVRGDAIDADPVRLSSLVRGERSGPSVRTRPSGTEATPEVAAGTGPAAPARPDTDTDTGRPMGPLLGSGFADREQDAPGVPFVFPRERRGLPAVETAMLPTDHAQPTLARIVPTGAGSVAPATSSSSAEASAPASIPGSPPAPPAAATPPSSPPRPEYARHIPGLRSLPARSPAHPEIELAVDEEGALHVLGGVTAVRELPLVANWALSHAELLAMACPDAEIDTTARPQGHVFTDDPLAVSDLHQSQLHLHLLAEIEVEGRRGWFVSPLHRPRG